MKLLFKQRFFSWFDSYDIYDEAGNPVYEVKGQLAWGHCLKIFNTSGQELGTVKQKVLSMMPTFEIYMQNQYVGRIRREFVPFKPSYNIDFNGWHVDGNFFEWDYSITGADGTSVATISKQLFHLTDTYVIDVNKPEDGLAALMLVLAIDAEKCSRSS